LECGRVKRREKKGEGGATGVRREKTRSPCKEARRVETKKGENILIF